ELAALSVLGSGEGVPTLDEVVDALPSGTGLVLELKETGIAEDALAAAAGVDDLVVSSFSLDALAECRAADPDVPLALNVSKTDGIAVALDLDCANVHPHHSLCDREYVARAHDAGLGVQAWTVEDRETARVLEDAGVDGVIADRSDVLT
ncbi:MAG TPA: glycerophosphodiester phosphodiesterase, partial [Halobacteriales archaeon]|nr:glycerophosphodiester phosphodiesterase [Halobacteriales archaeon]